MINKSAINDLLKKPGLKISLILGLVGFFISFVIVLIKGGDFQELVLRPLSSGIIMVFFWNLGYLLVKKFAPDFIREMQGAFFKSQNGESENYASSNRNDESDEFNFELDQVNKNPDSESFEDHNSNHEKISEDIKLSESETSEHATSTKTSTPKNSPRTSQRIGSDEMLVQGIAIKKDPELMARTIQHVLDTDD